MAAEGMGAAEVVRFVWSHPQNRGRRGRAVARLVLWQGWERIVRRPWTIDLQGLALRCYPHSTGATGALYCGLPEWEDMRFLLDFLRPGDHFVDVGANVGVYTLLAASVPDVDITAFEPATDTFQRLRENIALNHLEGRVELARAAVGAAPGTCRLSRGLDVVNRILADGETQDSEVVDVVALDAQVEPPTGNGTVFLKIDVEGAELDVLAGADRLLQARPVLVVEANDPAGLAAVLEPLGYLAYVYDPDRHELHPGGWKTPGKNNVLALADLAWARGRLVRA